MSRFLCGLWPRSRRSSSGTWRPPRTTRRRTTLCSLAAFPRTRARRSTCPPRSKTTSAEVVEEDRPRCVLFHALGGARRMRGRSIAASTSRSRRPRRPRCRTQRSVDHPVLIINRVLLASHIGSDSGPMYSSTPCFSSQAGSAFTTGRVCPPLARLSWIHSLNGTIGPTVLIQPVTPPSAASSRSAAGSRTLMTWVGTSGEFGTSSGASGSRAARATQ